jgi:hypothetical protein
MAFAAVVWLGYEFYRLLWQPSQIGLWQVHPGAIDLKQRYEEVHYWFAGKSVYGQLKTATYPPASYAIVWPLLGWLTLTQALWLWAGTTVATLGWLVHLIVRESGAKTPLERVFVALIPLSMYATGATIGNGQLIVHLLPMLLAGLLLLHRRQRGWRKDVLAAAFVLVTLVKPSVSVPFFWIVLFFPGRLRPALVVTCGYLAVTIFAASFQEPGFSLLLHNWIECGLEVSAWASVKWSHSNLHSWSAAFGLEEWNLPASLLMLLALGFWTYCNRHRDLWLLLGVAALVTRFWTYHGWYDDLLILLPMVTLFRIAKQGPSTGGSDVIAGALLGVTMLVMIAPGGLYLLSPPWNMFYTNMQMITWLTVLIFLVNRTQREKKRRWLPTEKAS